MLHSQENRLRSYGRVSSRRYQTLIPVAEREAAEKHPAIAFKAWLRGISQKVAEASKESSILDVGGVQVSDTEKVTLADISNALGRGA